LFTIVLLALMPRSVSSVPPPVVPVITQASRIAAFVQERRSRTILASAAVTMPRQ